MNSHESDSNTVELSVVMPCLNEAETLARCIHKAKAGLAAGKLNGEILISDNGSTDGSQAIAESLGVRVVRLPDSHTPENGYGSGLRRGIAAARGRFILMGDSDDSYDFRELERFMAPLRDGFDLVMGNRFKGGIRPGAMPPLHRYFGTPVLTALGRLFFHSPSGDFNCGMRAFSKAAFERMDLRTTGMEFASEMAIKAAILGLKVTEVPVTLSKDGRSRRPHLRTWRDGWRALRFMLLFSPRWLLLYPGVALMLVGLLAGLWLLPGPRTVGGVTFDIHTLLFAAAVLIIGFQAVVFSVLAKVFSLTVGLHPENPRFARLYRWFNLETGLLAGAILTLSGLAVSLVAVSRWNAVAFGPLDPSQTLRLVIPGVTTLLLGCQIIFCSLFLSILGLEHK